MTAPGAWHQFRLNAFGSRPCHCRCWDRPAPLPRIATQGLWGALTKEKPRRPGHQFQRYAIHQNQTVYTSAAIVSHYSRLQQLQPAERAIFARLQDQLAAMRMLDIGVGGGRTTAHWFPAVGDYLGIDYAAAMVAACEGRFAGLPRRPALAVMDARDLGGLGRATFDLVLFSFNGIDYVDHGDRLRILREIHHVLKPGGCLVFSSHNLYSLGRTFDLRSQLSWNPLKTYENTVMWGLTRLCNRSISGDRIATAGHLIVRDESHNFRLLTYYVRPEVQIDQLAFGFAEVEVYPWSQSAPLDCAADWSQTTDAWLYYVCVAGDRT